MRQGLDTASSALEAFVAQAAAQTRGRDPADCVLEERSYVRLSPDRGADEGIHLVRGGVILLGAGAVTSSAMIVVREPAAVPELASVLPDDLERMARAAGDARTRRIRRP